MDFIASCPSCSARLKVPDKFAGKRLKCAKCENAFVPKPPGTADTKPMPTKSGSFTKKSPSRPVPEPDSEDAPTPKRRQLRDEEDEGQDDVPRRPRQKSREEDDEDPKPQRKKKSKPATGNLIWLNWAMLILLSVGFMSLAGVVGTWVWVDAMSENRFLTSFGQLVVYSIYGVGIPLGLLAIVSSLLLARGIGIGWYLAIPVGIALLVLPPIFGTAVGYILLRILSSKEAREHLFPKSVQDNQDGADE